MLIKVKLYMSLRFFGHFLFQGFTWTALGLWTQNQPQVVGTCSGDGPQLIAFKIDPPKVLGLNPPLNKKNSLVEVAIEVFS